MREILGDMPYYRNGRRAGTLAEYDTYGWEYSGPAFVIEANKWAAKQLRGPCSTGHTGVVFQRSTVSFNQITDGTSHTYLFGEKNLQVEHYELAGALNDDQSMYNGWDKDNVRSTAITLLANGTLVTIGSYPPAPDTETPDQKKNQYQWAFGGAHSGGWQAVFCDGSVRSLSYDMGLLIHRDLGNRQDGNVIDSSQL